MVIALSLEGTPGTMTQAGTRGVPSCHCNCVREWVTCSQPDLHMPPLAGLLGGSPGSWPSPREQPPLGLVSNHQGLSQHVAPHGSPPPRTPQMTTLRLRGCQKLAPNHPTVKTQELVSNCLSGFSMHLFHRSLLGTPRVPRSVLGQGDTAAVV